MLTSAKNSLLLFCKENVKIFNSLIQGPPGFLISGAKDCGAKKMNGVFVRTPERINGCPTFVKAGVDVWWFYGSNKHWYLGNARNKSQGLCGFVSSVQCGIRNLMDPSLQWRADDPELDMRALEPEVRITPLEDLSLESLQALKLPVMHTYICIDTCS